MVLMGERVFRMVVALFVGVYVARYLGPERFGLLSYAMSFVGLFMALPTLGLDGIMVRELVKTPERRDELLGAAFWLKLGRAALMWVGIAAAIPFTKNDAETNLLIAIIAFAAIFQAVNVIDFNYQAEVKSKYVVHAQLVQLAISSITKLVFIWMRSIRSVPVNVLRQSRWYRLSNSIMEITFTDGTRLRKQTFLSLKKR